MRINVTDISTQRLCIGYEGEQNHIQVVFDCSVVFGEYPEAYAQMAIRPPQGDIYPKVLTRDGNTAIWNIGAADCAVPGNGEYQITFVNGETIVKSYIGFFSVRESLVANGEVPEPVEDWMEQAEAALNAFDNLTASAETLPAGSSATAEVTMVNGHKNVVFGIPEGEKGEPGDPTKLIDDESTTATNKVWSAKKSNDEVSTLLQAISSKQTAPASGSAAGKVLGLTDVSNELVPTWVDQPSVPVQDVQVNGVSVLSQGIANVPVANANDPGVVKKNIAYGIDITSSGQLMLIEATDGNIKQGLATSRRAIFTNNQHIATFYGLAKAAGADMASLSGETVGVYPEAQKSAISQMLDAPETVSGSTPSITAKSGVRYVCGEVSTLTVVLPASGCVDVVFESGSTATVLTITPPSGVTAVKWVGDFDPANLEANATYEINIMDGEWGMAVSWT